MIHYRQGDVLIQRIEAVPSDAQPITRKGDIILAYGEVTGHAHRLSAPHVAEWKSDNGRRFITVPGVPATVTHEEHGPIVLESGDYEVYQQVEYTPEALRNVAD